MELKERVLGWCETQHDCRHGRGQVDKDSQTSTGRQGKADMDRQTSTGRQGQADKERPT